jgi:hypothetical protein
MKANSQWSDGFNEIFIAAPVEVGARRERV